MEKQNENELNDKWVYESKMRSYFAKRLYNKSEPLPK